MRLYSTLSRQLEELPPPPRPIRMYFCGPTVYQRAHIGNARPFVLGMWLRAWLRHRGYDATFVHNITDVNDKIYDAAPSASAELAERATQWYLDDTGDLGLGTPDALPKATEAVPAIVAFIEKLIAAGHAYEADGDVYFDVSSDPGYGRLSRQKLEHMEPEEVSPLKRAAQDFALWKANKPGEDTSWESPWGRGRPGWHIECSVMAEDAFGPVFEIHGGGLDLVFPHHENELAQSLALGHEFARIWMHNGMLQFVGAKMSKSEGNVETIRDAIDRWGRDRLLVLFMTGHWRQPLDYSIDALVQANERLRTLRDSFLTVPAELDESLWDELVEALDDDFDTPRALEVIHDWAGSGQIDLVRRALALFGVNLPELSVTGFIQFLGNKPPGKVFDLVKERDKARVSRQFARADELRRRISDLGYEVRDVTGGYVVVRAGRLPHPDYDPLW